jgi:hypothetical protein
LGNPATRSLTVAIPESTSASLKHLTEAAGAFLQLLADPYFREPSPYDKRPTRINHDQPLHVSHEPTHAH